MDLLLPEASTDRSMELSIYTVVIELGYIKNRVLPAVFAAGENRRKTPVLGLFHSVTPARE